MKQPLHALTEGILAVAFAAGAAACLSPSGEGPGRRGAAPPGAVTAGSPVPERARGRRGVDAPLVEAAGVAAPGAAGPADAAPAASAGMLEHGRAARCTRGSRAAGRLEANVSSAGTPGPAASGNVPAAGACVLPDLEARDTGQLAVSEEDGRDCLEPGGPLVAHNVVNRRSELEDVLAAVESNRWLLSTTVRPSSEGMSISVRRH